MTALISVIFAELTIIGKLNSKDTLHTRTKSSKSSEINTFKMVQDTKYQTMVINIFYKYKVWNYFLTRAF